MTDNYGQLTESPIEPIEWRTIELSQKEANPMIIEPVDGMTQLLNSEAGQVDDRRNRADWQTDEDGQ